MHSSSMFLQISLYFSPSKLFLFSLILSASFIKIGSVALSACRAKSSDPNIPFSFGIFFLAVASVLAINLSVWINKQKKMVDHRIDQFERNGGNLLKEKLSRRNEYAKEQIKIYTAEDMKNATRNYSDQIVMRRCNPGTFYRGTLSDSDNTKVVIMQIPGVHASQIEQFIDQLIFLSQPNSNLVKIMGCCLETCFPLLVYELHGDGNHNLFDRMRNEAVVSHFSCERRVKAAAGAAKGLAYLQSQNSRAIADHPAKGLWACWRPQKSRAKFVHGNISSGNILLDDSFDAKVFYAVASSLINPRDISASKQTNCLYKDPYFNISTGRLDEKSDVHSFGVVLLEMLLAGKPLVPNRQENNPALDYMSLVTPEIFHDMSEADANMMQEFAMVAVKCLSVNPEDRPTMEEVEADLTKLTTLK